MTSKLSPAVEELTTRYWEWRIRDKPQLASFVGIHDYDDQLDDMSLAYYKKRYDQCKVFFDQAVALEGSLSLHKDLLNLRVLKAELETYIDGFPHQGFLMPLNYMEGIHEDFEFLISWMVFETKDDYEKLLSRYKQLPKQLSQIKELMEAGVASGIVNHAISMKNVGANLGKFVVKTAENSPLWAPLATLPDSFTKDQILDIQSRAAHIILEQVSPAFLKLQQYVENDYLTRPDIAITSIPGGEQFYAALVRFHTSTSLTPKEIHQMGIKEVERIHDEMAKIVMELGYSMSVSDFTAMIRNDPKFFFDNPDDSMASFQDIVFNQIQPRLADVFMNIPVTELKVVARSMPDSPHAFYQAGAYDGSRPGIYYVDISQCDRQPKYEMMTLSLHEGSPGHHLQGSHSIESSSMPFFRRVVEDSNYNQAPSRFPLNTAFMEGWGLYAETLGFDMKLFDEPYVRFGHYSFEIFRACRLVVDTGMHVFGWSRQEAIDYLSTHTAVTLAKIENEVDRYITWPGQALAYKIGQLKLKDLRQKAAKKLGNAFDLKKFHNIVLESVGPLSLVEEEVDAWIAAGVSH